MARHKWIDIRPSSLPVDLAKQWMPGSFEYAAQHLFEHETDFGDFTLQS